MAPQAAVTEAAAATEATAAVTMAMEADTVAAAADRTEATEDLMEERRREVRVVLVARASLTTALSGRSTTGAWAW